MSAFPSPSGCYLQSKRDNGQRTSKGHPSRTNSLWGPPASSSLYKADADKYSFLLAPPQSTREKEEKPWVYKPSVSRLTYSNKSVIFTDHASPFSSLSIRTMQTFPSSVIDRRTNNPMHCKFHLNTCLSQTTFKFNVSPPHHRTYRHTYTLCLMNYFALSLYSLTCAPSCHLIHLLSIWFRLPETVSTSKAAKGLYPTLMVTYLILHQLPSPAAGLLPFDYHRNLLKIEKSNQFLECVEDPKMSHNQERKEFLTTLVSIFSHSWLESEQLKFHYVSMSHQ